jgi:hypothetical protein
MFLAGDKRTPSLEITGDRIIARNEDPETIASIVKLAQHNGWEAFDVEGSPQFRKAVLTAAMREGLTVNGYKAEFEEAERMATLRRENAERRERQEASPRESDRQPDPGAGKATSPTTARESNAERVVGEMEAAAAVANAGATAAQSAAPTAKAERQSSVELAAGEPISGDEKAIFERALERGIRELEAKGDPRALAARETAAALIDQVYGGQVYEEREEQSVARSLREPAGRSEHDIEHSPEERQRDEGAEQRRGSDELAELFLHGSPQKAAADPRLANALEAQSAMEQHIAEVFQGDASQMERANLESRQMISDALRRGLDVAVREPTPVRQIEPVQTPDMER